MTNVFIVQHVHESAAGADDVKFIGAYSSRETAQAAVARLRRTAGFSAAPDGFHIDEYPVDHDHWIDGYATVTASGLAPASPGHS